jgi:23S rRNA (guanine745-N1)-methyltransferase
VDNALFAVASVYELPIFDAAADAVVNIFAPCVEEEYSRALKDGGLLVVVQAGKKHLLGLKNAIYDNIHENDTRADLPKSLSLICEKELLYEITVFGNENIKNLFEMTPYYWRTSQDDAKKLEAIDRLTTEIDILFSVYKKN